VATWGCEGHYDLTLLADERNGAPKLGVRLPNKPFRGVVFGVSPN
jgi:hypothetical protein